MNTIPPPPPTRVLTPADEPLVWVDCECVCDADAG